MKKRLFPKLGIMALCIAMIFCSMIPAAAQSFHVCDYCGSVNLSLYWSNLSESYIGATTEWTGTMCSQHSSPEMRTKTAYNRTQYYIYKCNYCGKEQTREEEFLGYKLVYHYFFYCGCPAVHQDYTRYTTEVPDL